MNTKSDNSVISEKNINVQISMIKQQLQFEQVCMKISNDNDKVACAFEYGDRTYFIGAGMNVIYGISSNNDRHNIDIRMQWFNFFACF